MITAVHDRQERDLSQSGPARPVSAAEDLVGRAIQRSRGSCDLFWRGPASEDSTTNSLLLAIPGAGFVVLVVVDGPLTIDLAGDASDRNRVAMRQLQSRVIDHPEARECGAVRWAHAVIAPDSEVPDGSRASGPTVFGRRDLDHLLEDLADLALSPQVAGRPATDEDITAAMIPLQTAPSPSPC